MDLLLEGTYDQIIKLGAKIQEKQKETKIAGNRLSCGIQLMQRLFRYKFNLDDTSTFGQGGAGAGDSLKY